MTPQMAAEWMLSQYVEDGYLYQETAASKFLSRDNETLAHFDANGNLCLSKKVLDAFKALTPDAVYERRDKFWRPRVETDDATRIQ
jgi:hypothetical protein